MKLIHLNFIFLIIALPVLSFAQPEEENKEIEFAFIVKADGKPGDALFLKEERFKDSYQYEVAYKIFESLIEARGDFRMQTPKLILTTAEKNVALARPRKGEIILEFKAYQICTTFGKDSLNALAALLSHELTHYYEKHQWTKHFVAEHGETQTGRDLKNLKERLRLETQSDYLGGFLAYSAGYLTLDIMPRFLDEVYKSYKLPDDLNGYPPLDERKEIATQAFEKLKSFIHVFEMANYLTALNQYEQAKMYFDYILTDFQSREIYNNVGVIAAQIGMQYVEDRNLIFGFPLELDVETRLVSSLRGNKENDLAKKVLEEAIQYFEKAIQLDGNYPIAMLNLACVYTLLNQFEDAEYFAKKALKLCDHAKWEKTKTDIYILQGILAYFQDDEKKARTLFQKSADSGNALAVMNLKKLNGQFLEGKMTISSKPTDKKDQIEDFSIDKAVVQLLQGELKIDKTTVIKEKTDFDPETICGTKQLKQSTLSIHFTDEDNYTFVQMANKSYPEKTNNDIKIGSPFKQIIQAYLEPDRRVEISKGSYFVYFNRNLIFKINEKGNVESWGVFRIKEKNG